MMKQLKVSARRGRSRSASPAPVSFEEAAAISSTDLRSASAAHAATLPPQDEGIDQMQPTDFEDSVGVAAEPESPIPQRSDIPGRIPVV